MTVSEILPELFPVLFTGSRKARNNKQKNPSYINSCFFLSANSDTKSTLYPGTSIPRGFHTPASFSPQLPESKLWQIYYGNFTCTASSLVMIWTFQLCSQTARGIPREPMNVCTPLATSPPESCKEKKQARASHAHPSHYARSQRCAGSRPPPKEPQVPGRRLCTATALQGDAQRRQTPVLSRAPPRCRRGEPDRRAP